MQQMKKELFTLMLRMTMQFYGQCGATMTGQNIFFKTEKERET